MNEIIVCRRKEWTSINGIEYLLDKDGEVMKFSDPSSATAYLRLNGYSIEDIAGMRFIYTNESRECRCHLCEKTHSECVYRDNPMRHPVGASTMGLGKCPKLK